MMEIPEVVTSVIDQGIAFIYGLEPIFTPTLVLGKQMTSTTCFRETATTS
jgi:hypothetical protein